MKHKFLGGKCLMMLFLIMFFEVAVSRVFADNETVDFAIEIVPSLSVSISDVSIVVGNGVVTGFSELSVSSNNSTGYVSSITTGRNAAEPNSTDLKHVAAAEFIPTLSAPTNKEDFPVNHWGVSEDDSTYYPLSAMDQAPILLNGLSKDGPGRLENEIYFGVNVDNSKMAGVYKNTILITVVANSIPQVLTLADVEYMQDVTSEICFNTATPASNEDIVYYELVDSRDDKQYYVTKLWDGNCWMTQNLDYDTWNEVKSGWEPPGTFYAETGAWYIDRGFYYDPGDIYVIPNEDDYEDDIIYYSFSSCLSGGYTEQECKMSHIGNFYDWIAAIDEEYTYLSESERMGYMHGGESTLEQEFLTNMLDNTKSICPSGWIMPKLREYNNGATWERMLSSGEYIFDGSRRITANLVRSGYAMLNLYFDESNILDGVAQYGHYWSSKEYTDWPGVTLDTWGGYDFNNFFVADGSGGFNIRCALNGTNEM